VEFFLPHNRNTYQLHYQNFHRDYAKFFRAFVYLNVLSGVRLRACAYLLCAAYSRIHCCGEQIREKSVRQILGKIHNGSNHGKEELRKITRKINIQLFHAFEGYLRQPRHGKRMLCRVSVIEKRGSGAIYLSADRRGTRNRRKVYVFAHFDNRYTA